MGKSNEAVIRHLDFSSIQNRQVIIFTTEWNEAVCNKLLKGCVGILKQHNITYQHYVVPGAVELPHAIRMHALKNNSLHGYIAFGCVVKGETPHFKYVCNMVSQGLAQLNVQLTSPVIFGVLTVDNMKQAEDRLGGKEGHKGEEAALAVLKMMHYSSNL